MVLVRAQILSVYSQGINVEVRKQNVTQHPTQKNNHNNTPVTFWTILGSVQSSFTEDRTRFQGA